MLYAMFGWNLPSGSGEEDFKISSMFFRYFVIIPLEKGLTFNLNKLDSPSHKDALNQVWLKLANKVGLEIWKF